MRIEFGTDGVRGVAGEFPCTPEVGVALGRAAVRLARDLGREPIVLVGRDGRPSGPCLEAAVSAGIAGEGGMARIVGVIPTPGLACALAAGLGSAGVQITASHNPWTDDGFKLLGPEGRKLTDAESASVEASCEAPPQPRAPGSIAEIRKVALSAYTSALRRAVPDPEAFRGRKVSVDLANGAATAIRPWLEATIPAVWSFTGAGGGPPNDGVGSESPENLRKFMEEAGSESGFAVDGDGDRCRLFGLFGAEIRPVDGDALAWLLATGRGDRGMAVTVMSTTALEASLPGVRVVRTPVGDRHLAAAMAADPEITLGCEESGHVLFSDGVAGGDGLLTGLRALACAWARGSVGDVVSGFRAFPRKLTKIRVRSRPDLASLPAFAEACRAGENALGPNGRVFPRYSGTEPVLRILVEGPEAEAVARVSLEVTRVATAEIGG